jgi:hypothetical protein
MKITIEIDIDSVVELLTKLREAEKVYSDHMSLMYEVYGSCDGSLMRAVQMMSSRTYQALELLGFEENMLYDWVHESDEFLLFSGGFIYDVVEPAYFAKYTLTTMKLKDFNPVGEYTEEDGKLIKTMYGE